MLSQTIDVKRSDENDNLYLNIAKEIPISVSYK